jgi:hypothetical protein
MFTIGLWSFTQFGIATDEGTMDALGRDTLSYVTGKAEWPTNPAWKYHGTVVELPLQVAQNIVAPAEDLLQAYKRVRVQHLSVFLLFFIGLIALFFLGKRHFQDWRWALLCCIFLFLSPRFFAHAFYNSRDIPALTFFTLSMLTLLRMAEKRTVWSAVIHGIATALALALRMPSLIIVVLTVLYMALDDYGWHLSGGKWNPKQSALLLAISTATTCVATVIFWPFLWEAPVSHFREAYTFMSSLKANTSWGYIAGWILLTTPLLYSIFFLYNTAALGIQMVTHFKHTIREHPTELLCAAWFFLPIAAVLITGAGIYDDWRHLYFVYPGFLLLSVGGLRSLMSLAATRHRYLLMSIKAIAALQLMATGLWMTLHHPFQYAYFSLPKAIVEASFSPGRPDYWGLSYKQNVRYLLDHTEGIISVYSPENIAYQNAYNVYPGSLKRLMRVPKVDEAMYVLVSSEDQAKDLPLVHEVRVDGFFLSGVYKGPVKEVVMDTDTGTIDFRK